jgi:hypothetical protein
MRCASGTTTCWSRSADGSWRDMLGRPQSHSQTVDASAEGPCTATRAWSVHGHGGLALAGGPVTPACPLLSEPSLDQGLLVASHGSGFCVCARYQYCTTVLQPPMQTLRFESTSHTRVRVHKPLSLECKRLCSSPAAVVRAWKQGGIMCYAQSASGQFCHRPESGARVCLKRLHQQRCRQYCELWLPLTGPQLWSTRYEQDIVSGRLCLSGRASGGNRPTTVSITTHLPLRQQL